MYFLCIICSKLIVGAESSNIGTQVLILQALHNGNWMMEMRLSQHKLFVIVCLDMSCSMIKHSHQFKNCCAYGLEG